MEELVHGIIKGKFFKLALALAFTSASVFMTANAFAANARTAKIPWTISGDSNNAGADGYYVATKFGNNRSGQKFYQSVPKNGDKDEQAFISRFSSDGVSSATIKLFHEKIASGEISCRGKIKISDADLSKGYKNTYYRVYDNSGDGSPTTNVNTVRDIKDSGRQGMDIGEIEKCFIQNDAYPDGEVVYAQRNNCANPLYANFKLLTETAVDPEGEIKTEAFIRRSGEDDTKWVPSPATADEEYDVTSGAETFKVSEINVEKGKKVDFKHVSTNTSGIELSHFGQQICQFKTDGKVEANDIACDESSMISINGKDEVLATPPVAPDTKITTVDVKGVKEIETKDLADGERVCQVNLAYTNDYKKVAVPTVASNIVCAKTGDSTTPEDETEIPDIPGLPTLPELPPLGTSTTWESDYEILAESRNVTTDTDFLTLGYDYDVVKISIGPRAGIGVDDIKQTCNKDGLSYLIRVREDRVKEIASDVLGDAASSAASGGITLLISAIKAVFNSAELVQLEIELAELRAISVAGLVGDNALLKLSSSLNNNYTTECHTKNSSYTSWLATKSVSVASGYPKDISSYAEEAKTTYSGKNGSGSGSSTDPADTKYGITYAKPTDLIQFRNRISKLWYDVEPDLNSVVSDSSKVYAPSRSDNSKETCTVSTPYPNTDPTKHVVVDRFTEKGKSNGTEVTVLRTESVAGEGNGFFLDKACKSGEQDGAGNTITNKFEELRPKEGYPTRPGYTVKIEAKSVNNDVGKKFVDEINTQPTWVYPDQWTCIKGTPAVTDYSKTTATGKCEQFGTSKVTETKTGASNTGWSAAQVNVPFNYTLTPVTNGTPSSGDTDCMTYSEALAAASADGASGNINDHLGCHTDDVKGTPKEGFPNYGIVYAGENFTFSSNIITNPRANPDVTGNNDDEYSTYTRNTEFKIVSFALAPDSAKPTGYGFSSNAPSETSADCGYYGGTSVTPYNRKCIVLKSKAGSVYNQGGDLGGTGTEGEALDPSDNEVDVVIDDLPVGSKVCFAAAVYPADSHADPHTNQDGLNTPVGAGDPTQNIDGAAMTNKSISADKWAYGAPYCVTIAKKPNSQTLIGGTYSGNDITTSQSPKYIHSGAEGNPFIAQTATGQATSAVRGTANSFRRLFGSWTEQEVIALGGIGGHASGALLGYTNESNGNLSNGYPDGNSNTNKDSAVNSSYSMTKSLCLFSKMTISNVSCDNITGSSVGGMGGELETMNPLILDRLFNRYLGPVDSASGPGEKAKLLYHIVYCTGLPGEGSCSGDGNEAAAVMEDGVSTIIVPRGKVYVYDLRNYSGDKTITHNIRYADEAYSGISELPQAIIVSGDLTIAANVTNIDAWIITMYTGQEDGLLSTCPDDPADATTCDKPLTVNGPVYASSVKLNRTYGAFGGSKTCNSITSGGGSYVYAQDSYCSSVSSDGLGFRGSIAPAERFILRPDTFLWTYAQAQIVPKATSVYTYEPSPSF